MREVGEAGSVTLSPCGSCRLSRQSSGLQTVIGRVASDKASFVSGQIIGVNGGKTAA